MKPAVILDGLSFPEGPRWHNGELWFSDIHAHRVMAVTPAGKSRIVAELGDRPSGLGFLPGGDLLVVSMIDRRLLRVDGQGRVHLHADVSHLSGHFINDMVVDSRGRAYVGSRSGRGSGTDTLILVEPDGTSRTVAGELSSPNGAVVSAGGDQLTVAETALGQLTTFRIGDDGSLHDRRITGAIPGAHIDGIALDRAGRIWCGTGPHGAQRLAGGRVDAVIERPGRMTIACAMGGADGTTLYLATASRRLYDNLRFVDWDRTRDHLVHSDGRIEAVAVEN